MWETLLIVLIQVAVEELLKLLKKPIIKLNYHLMGGALNIMKYIFKIITFNLK